LSENLTAQAFAILFQRFVENNCSDEETRQLLELAGDPEYQGLTLDLIEARLQDRGAAAERPQENLQRLLDARFEKIMAGARQDRKVRKLLPMKWAAAAAILIVMAGAGWFFLRPVTKQDQFVRLENITAPQKNKARISLGNGRILYLDSLANGSSIEADGVTITKLSDGQIVYSGSTENVIYNTASNPRGSTVIDFELSDHSHVWLNSGSSITYPIAFTGGQRKVSIDGEAYFEVAHDASKPFIVSKGNTHVQVLGTHFNVKAFGNEPHEQITLLEGKVKVNSNAYEQLLNPSEQAIVTEGKIELNSQAALSDVMAWKNGFTSFHGSDLRAILRELERWYDITTEMQPVIKETLTIDVPRNVPLKDVLKSLLEDNGIKYEYDADTRKLIVLP
jgi:transmembrane sensor